MNNSNVFQVDELQRSLSGGTLILPPNLQTTHTHTIQTKRCAQGLRGAHPRRSTHYLSSIAPFSAAWVLSPTASQENVRSPNHHYFSTRVSQYTCNSWCDTLPISIAVLSVPLSSEQRETLSVHLPFVSQCASHLYRKTPPICTATKFTTSRNHARRDACIVAYIEVDFCSESAHRSETIASKRWFSAMHIALHISHSLRIYPYPMVWPLPRPWSETMVSIPLWAQKTLEIKVFLAFLDLVSQTPRPRVGADPCLLHIACFGPIWSPENARFTSWGAKHIASQTCIALVGPHLHRNAFGKVLVVYPVLLFLGLFKNTKENLKNTKDFAHLANT